MNLNDIKSLIDKINASDLAYFELKTEDGYVKMDKSLTRNFAEKSPNSLGNVLNSLGNNINGNTEQSVKQEVKVTETEESVDDSNTITINAPMVGTFYGSAAPGKDAFVSKGSKVSKGEVLCIVEAMKLMNEIECEFDCEIVEILVKEGQMVEYGEPLFKVRRG